MLQQILREMYVSPNILAELDDQQKQTLFCKMRAEQVRRWKLWNDKLGDDPKPIRTPPKKYVQFLHGADGEPWVWVMGEHQSDKSIEQILQEEAIEAARKMAEKEAEEFRKCYETQLSDYCDLSPKIEAMAPPAKLNDNDMDIYCSVDELREKIGKQQVQNSTRLYINEQNNKLNSQFGELGKRDKSKVAQRVELWEKRLTEERTCEIFRKFEKKREEVAREAEEGATRQEQLWQEQERKAKQAELQIREIARRAREEHKLANFEIDTSYSTVPSNGIPPGRAAVIDWYQRTQKSRLSGLDTANNIEPWFHGLITRSDAEQRLVDQAYGSFLVRLSERIWGYAISYKAKEKCKHFLISATGDKYQFLGSNQIGHKTLGDLIEYHQVNPLTDGEKLITACPRGANSTISELFETNNL